MLSADFADYTEKENRQPQKDTRNRKRNLPLKVSQPLLSLWCIFVAEYFFLSA